MPEIFVLSNGVEIPQIGYGTWKTPDGKQTYEGVRNALQVGYRHVDTAAVYGNEASVGKAIKDSGVKREDVFVTSKHWIDMRGYEKTIKACEDSLRKLETDFLDLYLIHWPCVERFRMDWKEINADTWRGFEKLYRDGKVRAIGVSNFQRKHLEALRPYAQIQPMVDQIEFHPGYLQLDDVHYMQENGILPQAWSPLGNGAVLQETLLIEMAQKYRKTAAQICIRFCLQKGVLPLTKSMKPERMKQSLDVFDFTLLDEDMKQIESMPLLAFTGLLPENAPHDIK
ncbi:MAG: aldo/keto reductase [Lachnospiraceae bacterium]|nr:aldo/keto reductase [Lachnospiraceae bacterium]